MTNLVLHVALLIGVPPLLPGVINKTKAWSPAGPGRRFFSRTSTSGSCFEKGPSTVGRRPGSFAPARSFRSRPCSARASFCRSRPTPRRSASRETSSLFAYLLGLGRFFTMAAALDTGSSFEGMGASREAAFSAFAEPALFLSLAIVCVPAGSATFGEAFGALPWATLGGLAPDVPGRGALSLRRSAGGELADPRGRSEHAPRADDGPRGHGARPWRPGLRASSSTEAPSSSS